MKEKRPEEINNWLLKAALDCVKDESSLDIDLSVCAPIPSAPSDNTLSDVWNTHQETCDKEANLKYQDHTIASVPLQPKPGKGSQPVKVKVEATSDSLSQGAFSQIKTEMKETATVDTSCTSTYSPIASASIKHLTSKRCSTAPDNEQNIRSKAKVRASNVVRVEEKGNIPVALVKKECEPEQSAAVGGQLSLKRTGTNESLKCKNCSETFDSKESLKAHGKVHKTNRKNEVYTCPICEKQLKVSSMWLHRKIHNESERFSCDICGQKFVQKINLIHHTKAHLGEKPFECSQCQMSFPERSHLIKHQRYHTSTRQYKCEKCGKMYKTERCLKVHNLVHLEKRPFVCGECNKSFISSSKLKQHSNIHTGERPYKCKYCARDFTNFPNWLKHTRRRHKVDHKTGESLETIPSYVSKKSDKKKGKTVEPITLSSAEKRPASNFTDIYAMSLNSAEELIMEQALEMEESGYIMSPPSDATLGSPPLLSHYDYMPPASQDVSELPLSSFQYYLPSLSPLHNSGTTRSDGDPNRTNDMKTLPSVETLFASTFQKASFHQH